MKDSSGNQKTIKHNGRDIKVREVDVVMETERWNEYQLANGVVLSVKTVLVKVMEGIGEQNPDGTTLYLVNTQCIVKTK